MKSNYKSKYKLRNAVDNDLLTSALFRELRVDKKRINEI